MTTITTRTGKGTPLTHGELDTNLTNLNTDKVEKSGDSSIGSLALGYSDFDYNLMSSGNITFKMKVNGYIFALNGFQSDGAACVFSRNVTAGGMISSPQSAMQIGLSSTDNGDSIAAGGGPSMLFFGFTDANPPAKAFIGRISGYVESGVSGDFYGGIAVQVRANNADSNAATTAARWTASKNFVQEGYSQLGGSSAPAIKMKKLTGTTNSAEGGTAAVAHGLTGSKIIGFTCKVDYAGDGRGMANAHTYFNGYHYDVYHDATNFIVANHATNSENILSKSFTILVTYEE